MSSMAEKTQSYTRSKLENLKSLHDKSAGKAMYAKLRHGVDRKPGELPELWAIIFENIPQELEGKKDASAAEWAIYISLTLYAYHQQGNDQLMDINDSSISIGKAAARLAVNDDETEKIIKRLNLVATSDSMTDLAYHLKEIVSFLKKDNIQLDYARLAGDIYNYNFPEGADRVKLTWGRDFFNQQYIIENKGEDNNG